MARVINGPYFGVHAHSVHAVSTAAAAIERTLKLVLSLSFLSQLSCCYHAGQPSNEEVILARRARVSKRGKIGSTAMAVEEVPMAEAPDDRKREPKLWMPQRQFWWP